MKKLLQGVVEFRNQITPQKREHFAHLALEQRPDALLVGCSDSRVVPNLFASTQPGDVFVVRNVGNMIPPCCPDSEHDCASEAAAIDFAMLNLPVKDIIICGHSECGAMNALYNSQKNPPFASLNAWLRMGQSSLESFKNNPLRNYHLKPENQLSQIHVLEQIKHISTYPNVQNRLKAGTLKLHAWWFDIAQAEIFIFDETENSFVPLDSKKADQLMADR